MKKIKILYIVEAMTGGVFTYLVDLANTLVKQYDFEVCIAYSIREQTPQNYADYFDKRIQLIMVPDMGRAINPIKDCKAFVELKKIMASVKPDVVHFHSSKAGVLGRFAVNGKKIPAFYTPHGYSFLMENESRLKRLLYKFIEKVCSYRCCTTISCSKGEHEETLKLTSKAYYVDNGVNIANLSALLEESHTAERESGTVFTLGRICHQKNPKLFNEIAKAMPDTKFVWIGDGELRYELTAKNIEVTGWVDREKAILIAQGASVFILTSLWEGLPISLLEAMYMKKSCIVSNVIGNRDVIHNVENGYVCDNLEDFVAAIRDSKNHVEYREYAQREVLEHYNTENMARQYYGLYMKQLKEKEAKCTCLSF